ncbi:MAG: hydroxyacid dehydrogenase [Chloroflexota bacterium]
MSLDSRKKMAFFEVEEWERGFLSTALMGHDLYFYRQPLDEKLANKAKDAEIVSVFIRSDVSRAVLDKLPKLRLVVTRSTGFDHIDIATATEKGVLVSNIPFYGENTVAEHTFGLILALSRNIHKAYLRTAAGDFSLQGLQGFDLQGKTIGVIGAGHIGLRVIRIAKGFGMRVLAYDVCESRLIADVLGFRYVSLNELLRNSDIISLHAPYNPSTHHLINRDTVRLIKRGAILINTARGGLVDTDALIWALDNGILSGAGLDVVEGEELIQEEKQLLTAPRAEEKLRQVVRQHILLRREDVVITPHIGFYSRDALRRIMETTVGNITTFLQGHPQNLVNPQVLGEAAACRLPE